MKRTYTIQVSHEVYRHLEKNAAPFSDTPDTVLRRLLKLSHGERKNLQDGHDGALSPLLEAGVMQADEKLVWNRPRKGVTHTVTVTNNGCIALPDGGHACTLSAAADHFVPKAGAGVRVWTRTDGTKIEDLLDRFKQNPVIMEPDL